MNKLSVIFLIAIISLSACNKKESDFVSSLVENNKKQQSVHFKLTQKYYYSNGEDTTTTPYEVWVTRDSNDSLRNGYIWVDDNYRPYNMVYEMGDFYLSIPPKKTSILYPNFSDNIISNVDWIDIFLNPETFEAQIKDSLNKALISDTLYNEVECSKIVINFPVNKKGASTSHTYLISKQKNTPLWAMMKLVTKDYTYFDELYFTDFEFNTVNQASLKEKHKEIIAANPIERGGDNSEISRLESMLHIGDDAPMFDGSFYSDEQEFKLNDYLGKNIIIVDFWYTHCPPCVKAMPALSALYEKHKDKGLKVFGLNSVDNQAHSLDNLSKFLKKRKTSYDIIMIQPEVDMMYKVNGYPTMYIIDKEGKIAFAEIGYDEQKFAEFVNKVEELLEE